MTRKEFEALEYPYEPLGWDFVRAIKKHGLEVPETFTVLCAMLSEAHDEGEYFWLLLDGADKYYVLTGSHDYTGWDCQSHAELSAPFEASQLALYAPEYDNQNRPIRATFLKAMESQ